MKTHRTPPLVVIVGPTACGKTAVVHAMADAMPGPIISADSMQVYRYMDIGTAKPARTDREKRSYHLVDVVDPDEAFNAAMFLEMSSAVIDRQGHSDAPVYVAGGTGLYVKILLGGLISIKFGVTAIFFIGPLLFLLLVPITNWSKKTLALQESTA